MPTETGSSKSAGRQLRTENHNNLRPLEHLPHENGDPALDLSFFGFYGAKTGVDDKQGK